MNSTAIRQKLHNYLEVANDKKIKAIYTTVEDAIEEVEYTDEFRAVPIMGIAEIEALSTAISL